MKVTLSPPAAMVLSEAWRRGAPALAYRAAATPRGPHALERSRDPRRPWAAVLVASEDSARIVRDNLEITEGPGVEAHFYDGTRWLW